MAGGIQKGMVATDTQARKLDNQCKFLKEELASQFPTLTMQRKLRQDQIPSGVGACEPDGGVWFKDGELFAIFEAKKQQDRGNAIERWFKNNYIARAINPNVHYITFAVGQGASNNGVITKALNIAHMDGFDTFVPNKNSCFRQVEGFTDEEIRTIMIEVLNS